MLIYQHNYVSKRERKINRNKDCVYVWACLVDFVVVLFRCNYKGVDLIVLSLMSLSRKWKKTVINNLREMCTVLWCISQILWTLKPFTDEMSGTTLVKRPCSTTDLVHIDLPNGALARMVSLTHTRNASKRCRPNAWRE